MSGRSNSSAIDVIRSLQVMDELLAGDGFEIFRLAVVLGVSRRTLHRHLELLEQLGQEIVKEQTGRRDFTWRYKPGCGRLFAKWN